MSTQAYIDSTRVALPGPVALINKYSIHALLIIMIIMLAALIYIAGLLCDVIFVGGSIAAIMILIIGYIHIDPAADDQKK